MERASGSEEVKRDAEVDCERRLWHWKILRRRRIWRHIRDIDIEEDMKREEVMECLQDSHSELTITMSSVFPNESKYLTHIGWWLRRSLLQSLREASVTDSYLSFSKALPLASSSQHTQSERRTQGQCKQKEWFDYVWMLCIPLLKILINNHDINVSIFKLINNYKFDQGRYEQQSVELTSTISRCFISCKSKPTRFLHTSPRKL